MNKNIIKRILNLIDTLEINKTSIRSLISQLEKELKLQFCETSREPQMRGSSAGHDVAQNLWPASDKL